jgi:hypothetical protein
MGIIGGHWELVTLWCVGAILFFAAGIGRVGSIWRPDTMARLSDWMTQSFGPKAPTLALVLWCLSWVVYFAVQDPNWVPSGIDWHDSYLDAYALAFNDPPLYCAWRYPFYPAVSAAIAGLPGLDLSITTQLVSRVVSVGVVVPVYFVGRTLYGRAAAISGILLLGCLATFRMHTDAVTPYPMVMFLGAAAAWGIVGAARGGITPFLMIGLSVGGLLANDGKSLAISLGMMALALPMALLVPHRWEPKPTTRPRPKPSIKRFALSRSLRLLLLLTPIVMSYRWMGALPVKAFTLEEMAVAYLMPGGRGENQETRNLQDGYMWGHLSSVTTIPTTLKTFYDAGKDPALAQQNARQWRTSLQRLRLDYPGFTQSSLMVLGLCLLVPVLRRKKTWAERAQLVLQTGAVVVVLASCWPSIKSDYQERYVVHGAVWLPMILMGGVDAMARLIIDRARPQLRWLRGLAVVTTALFLLLWPGNPISMGTMSDRLDPVAMGGLQEYEVGVWGRENLSEGDVLLDTSWMMQALILSGSATVARAENAYPPGGAPWPAGSWRFTRPWPSDDNPPTQFFALVNYLAMAPNTFDAEHIPIEELITGPDSPAGKAIIAQPGWSEVFRTSDTIVRVYQWTGKRPPKNWQTRRRVF